MDIESTQCPECGRLNTLRIENVLDAKPIGDFSLAGAAMKFSARSRPKLVCAECPYQNLGEYDGRYAVFQPEVKEVSFPAPLPIKESQHCTSKECPYTISHTATWCGYEQPRRCGCPYCYPK